jgi:hypothetical protein
MQDEAFTPDESDAFISDSPRGYGISMDGRFIGTYERERQAEAALYLEMERAGYFPNVWRVNDHGNVELCYFDSHVLRHAGIGYV